MSIRINSTGRKRLLRESVRLRIIEGAAGQPPTFTAHIQFPAAMGLSPSARVYVEPYVGSSSMRFDFGTVARVSAPDSCALTDVDAGANVLFRIKVVDESSAVGRILASADGVRPVSDEEGDDRKSILPLRTADLGELVWSLQVDKDAGPTLVVNSRLPGISDRLLSDVLLQGAIYPEVVKAIARVALGESVGSDDESADWLQEWRRWFSELIGREIEPEERTDPEALAELIDKDIAQSFAARQKYVPRIAATLSE